jgi:hypothetical protein
VFEFCADEMATNRSITAHGLRSYEYLGGQIPNIARSRDRIVPSHERGSDVKNKEEGCPTDTSISERHDLHTPP